jgi:ribosome-binding protein aMBF1 (putative translation factor)
MPPVNKVDAGRVRQLVAAGLAATQIAARLGCSASVVSRIAKGKYEKEDRKR